jgi:hypothetical protein
MSTGPVEMILSAYEGGPFDPSNNPAGYSQDASNVLIAGGDLGVAVANNRVTIN